MALPLRTLGFSNPEGFPVNFTRARVLENEPKQLFSWSPYLTKGFHDLEMFGSMLFGSPAPCLVRNGDFSRVDENDRPHDWQPGGKSKPKGTWTMVRDRFVTAGRSLKLEGSGKGDSISVRQSLPALQPETEYVVSFAIRTENLTPATKSGGALISIWDERNHYFPKNPCLGTMPWQRQRFVFRTGKSTNQTTGSYLALILREASGTAWFDDIRIVPVPPEE